MAIPIYREILELKRKGVNNISIADLCHCSRTTVIRTIAQATKVELDWETAQYMTDAQLKKKLYPKKSVHKKQQPDMEYLDQEQKAYKHVTLMLLWKEYLEECKEKKKAPLMYSRFCHYYQQHKAENNVSGHIERYSGISCETDWAGAIMHWQDEFTGEQHSAYLFVACLSYSRYAYCEAFIDQGMRSWITAHNHMFTHFHGVTQIIICDNLKTGVVKHVKGETKINKTYLELARHYGTVISPAAVRSPKGKPNVEDSVGIIANNIIAALRKHQFFSLAELNTSVWQKLEELNTAPFQKREGSRKLLFDIEQQDLQPLPATAYEMSEWHTDLTVQYNYHVKVGKYYYYSVPYTYVGKKVSLRMTTTLVEIFYEQERIASHRRNYDRSHRYMTDETHMPTAQQEAKTKWNERRFLSWARSVGPHTERVISSILTGQQIIQQAYQTCMALLVLSRDHGKDNLEQVCSEILLGGYSPSLTNVRNMLSAMSHSQHKQSQEEKLQHQKPTAFLRDPSYFKDSITREDSDDQK